MNIEPIFINFLATENLNLDLKHISDVCYKFREKDSGRVVSNLGGWQSNFLNMNDISSKLFFEVMERIHDLCCHFNLKTSDIDYDWHTWININKTGDMNISHAHGISLFSGVFYVKAEEKCGNIIFKNPMILQQFAIGERKIEKYNSFNSITWHIPPKSGDLIIFPSWLEHYVEPNLSNEDRISIAFNFS